MASTPTSQPPQKTNRIGLTVLEYKGGKTTLCAGCGHNAISERIIDAMYEMGVKPEQGQTYSHFSQKRREVGHPTAGC